MTDSKKQGTFYFHDYETFGKHPALDRPAQFAGVRTDAEFNIIEEPLVLYCQPSDDYLPDAEAVLITGITPQHAKTHGVCEAEFARQIHHAFSQPNSCIIGYNNLRFDDEVTRYLLYRNFYDPYAYSWQEGNSRWDLLDVVRACYALRPTGVQWPVNDDGLPSFKLEHLTAANQIAHQQAHDAMSDVYATIAMAKLIKQAQPRLFDYLFQQRNKHNIAALIDIVEMTPLVHVSGMFGALRSNLSLISPLAWHPDNKNAIICCDLNSDLTPLFTLNSEQLKERLYTKRSELAPDELPIPLKLIHTNRCPVLAPQKTLLPDTLQRLELDHQRCLNNWQQLKQHPEVREKVIALYADAAPFPAPDNVDQQLYNGFFSGADRAAMQLIRHTTPRNLPALELTFSDPRMAELLFRYKARNFPDTLNETEQQRWQHHRQECLSEEKLQHYFLQLDELAQLHSSDEKKIALLTALFNYARQWIG